MRDQWGMSNVLTVSLQATIYSLHDRGWSRRRIARELGIDRETVGRYLLLAKPAISTTGAEGTGEAKPAISIAGKGIGRKSQCEPLAEGIMAKVEVGLSAQRIYQDLVEEIGFTDSYQSVKRFVRKLRASQPERVWRLECQPGEELQLDFGLGAPLVVITMICGAILLAGFVGYERWLEGQGHAPIVPLSVFRRSS